MSDTTHDLSITIWNANGLTKQLINTVTSSLSTTTLLFITETWLLPPSRYPTDWTQYHTYGKEIPNSYRGSMGISLLVHPACPYPVTIIPNSSPYSLSCEIAGHIIHCVYLPPSTNNALTDPAAINLLEDLVPLNTQHPTIICGDINARHTLFGDSKTTERGYLLHDFLVEFGFDCLNQSYAFGQPTFISRDAHHTRNSIVDLFLSTGNLNCPHMSVHDELDLESDHKPVTLHFYLPPDTSIIPPPTHPRQLWRLQHFSDNTKLERYQDLCTTNLEPVADMIQLALNATDDQPDIEAIATAFTSAIYDALNLSVGQMQKRPIANKWFWNDELEKAFHHRELCYRKWRKSTGLRKAEWYDKHQEATDNFRSLVRQRKYHTWRDYCTRLATGDFSKTTATIKRIRQHRTKHPTFSSPAGPQAAAAQMAQHLERSTYSGQYLPSRRVGPPPQSPAPHPIDNDCPFTEQSVIEALKSVARRKAPGVDHLRAEMFTPVLSIVTPVLTALFQLCWRWSSTPVAWRVAQVLPIYKKGEPTDPGNYRPISLTSVLRKVMEICLAPNLHAASPPLDIAQGGFRPQRSALDQALCLQELVIRHRRATGADPVLCFLDIGMAYDVTDRAIVWRALELDAPPALLGLLRNLFDDVFIEVIIAGSASHRFTPKTGVLQGSILSPHLYSLYINSLPDTLRDTLSISDSEHDSESDFLPSPFSSQASRPIAGQWINALLYADDVVIIATPTDMPRLLARAERHSLRLGYRWKPQKCVVLNPPASPLQLYGEPLTNATSFAYLGIPFNNHGNIDPGMLAQRNISSTVAAMRVLHNLGCSPAGFPRHLAVRLYKQFIRPKFEYGLAITRFRKKDVKLFDRAQDRCLRMLFGGHATSSTLVFRHMADLPTMGERIAILGAKFLLRLQELPSDALLPTLQPHIRNARLHLLPKLKTNPLWLALPDPPSERPTTDLKIAIANFRLTNLGKMRAQDKGGVLISAYRDHLGGDPILWLPMTSRERSRLIRWRMGWLPGKPQPCKNCNVHRTSRHHLIDCYNAADKLGVRADIKPNPIDYVLNTLPRKQPPPRAHSAPFSERYKFWSVLWPAIAALMLDFDSICQPDQDFSAAKDDPALGQQFLQWLDNRLPPPDTDPIPPDSNISADLDIEISNTTTGPESA